MKGTIKGQKRFIKFIPAKMTHKSVDESVYEGFINGEFFSQAGKIKLQIFDDGSLTVTSTVRELTIDEAKRYLQHIEDCGHKSLSAQRLGLNFCAVDNIDFYSDDGQELLLVIESQRPYAKLDALFDEPEISKPNKLNRVQKAKFSQLLDILSDEDQLASEKDDFEAAEVSPLSSELISQSFEKMKMDKYNELSKKLTEATKTLKKLNSTRDNIFKEIDSCKAEIIHLEQRLDSLQLKAEDKGYFFWVSERQNEKAEIEEETLQKIESVLKKIPSINSSAFMKLFENGEYQIKIWDKDKNLLQKVDDELIPQALMIDSSLYMSREGHLIYKGEFDWHSIVNSFVKLGLNHINKPF